MKKRIILIATLLLLSVSAFIIINVAHNNKNIEKKNIHKAADNKAIRYSTLKEIRKDADKEVTALKNGEYGNLSTGEIIPDITEADEVVCIHINPADPIGENRLEILEKQREILDYYLGKDLNEAYFFDDTTGLSYEEAKEAIENGTYEPMNGIPDANPFLGYTLEAETLKYLKEKSKDKDYQGEHIENTYGEGEFKYGHVSDILATVWINKGKIYAMEEPYQWATPDDYFEIVEECGVKEADMKKEVKLSNGSITLGEAVDFAEEYFAKKLPYEVNDSVRKKVETIREIKVSDDVHIIRFRLVRSYKGLLFEGQEEGTIYTEIPKYAKDCSYAYMVDTDDVDIYYGETCAVKTEEDGKGTGECVTLDSALQLVSQSIGENSEYEVSEIRTIYRIKKIDEQKNQFYGVPCWKISGINRTSGEEIAFYVNLENGELDYETTPKAFDESAFQEG